MQMLSVFGHLQCYLETCIIRILKKCPVWYHFLNYLQKKKKVCLRALLAFDQHLNGILKRKQ